MKSAARGQLTDIREEPLHRFRIGESNDQPQFAATARTAQEYRVSVMTHKPAVPVRSSIVRNGVESCLS